MKTMAFDFIQGVRRGAARKQPPRRPWNRLGLLLAAPGVVALAFGCGPAEARLYRWVDESGAVHYTDQVPPSQVEKGHTELNDRGLRVDTVPPAKSVEEVQRERALERLRAQQERLVEQQNAADRALLRTYRSIDDLIMARDGKVAAIDVVIGVARAKAHRQQERLEGLQAEAANLERAGKPVPQHLAETMAKSEREIQDIYGSIVEREQQKDRIRVDFDREIKRFRQLRKLPEDGSASAEDGAPDLGNLVPCKDDEECARLWQRALSYVKAHATTPIQTLGPNILITASPQRPEDVSLTLSLIRDTGLESASLFLDLQCKAQGPMENGCKDQRSLEILEGFRDAVSDPPATGKD